MAEVPFGGTDVGDRLRDIVFWGERSADILAELANALVVGSEVFTVHEGLYRRG